MDRAHFHGSDLPQRALVRRELGAQAGRVRDVAGEAFRADGDGCTLQAAADRRTWPRYDTERPNPVGADLAMRNRGRFCCCPLHAVRHLVGHCALLFNSGRCRSYIFADRGDGLLDGGKRVRDVH